MEKALNDLVLISRKYGSDPGYVIAGGGNTSWKSKDHLYIKASGVSLATISASGFCILDRGKLAEIPGMALSDDPLTREEQVKNALLSSRVDPASGLRPSVETSLHDLFGYAFVVHTHPTLVNGLLCSREAESQVNRLFNGKALFIPYCDPGFVLFTFIRKEILAFRATRGTDPQIVLIQNHGIFVAADTIEEIDRLYEEVFTTISGSLLPAPVLEPIEVSPLVADILPAVRMILSGDSPGVARAFHHQAITPFITDAGAFNAISTPFTPDQMVYCLSEYLFIENNSDREEMIHEINLKAGAFRQRKGVPPRVVFIRDQGVIIAGEHPLALDYLEALVLDFTRIALLSNHFGGAHPMTPAQIAFIESWEVENYRKKVALSSRSRGQAANKVVLITGAAQGFGAGIAELMFGEGAHVVIADLNEEKGSALARQLNDSNTTNKACFVPVNVAQPAAVEEMVRRTVLRFGGIDVLISNAGILRAGSLDQMTPETFDLMTRVNYNAYFLCTKYVSAVMKLQHRFNPGHFMDIIQINSKSGLKGSNKNFAYAGAKFGGIGLTQSFALELMPFRIKVNAICPGNFFDGPLWADPDNGLFVQYLKAGKVKGARTIEEVRQHYEAQVPAGRGCLPSDVVKAIYYIMVQEYETGQAIPVTGGQEMLN